LEKMIKIFDDIDKLIEDFEKIAPLILTENNSIMISFDPNLEKKSWLQLKTDELKRIKKEISKNLEINLNDIVIFELTDIGKEIYKKYEDKQNIPDKFKMKNLDEKLELQLWKLFEVFGKYMYIGCQIPFINNLFKINLKKE